MLTALFITGMIVYIIHLGSRITKLERILESKGMVVNSDSQNANNTVLATSTDAPTKPNKFVGNVSDEPSKLIPDTDLSASNDSKGFINALPKIGVIALVFGLAFFLKYAIDQGWISIYLRLALGGVVGGLMLVLYYLWREKYQKYSLALAGGGLAIWYLTVFAAVRMYDLLDLNGGMVLFIVITVIGLLLAYKTKSATLSALTWGGAFLAPMLLGLNTQNYSLLLVYLTIVSVALLASIYYNKNNNMFALVIVGNGVNLLATTMGAYRPENYYLHTMLFLALHLFVYTGFISSIVHSTGTTSTDVQKNEFSVLTFVIYIVFGIPLAIITFDNYRDYASLIMFGLGAWTFLIYSLIDRLEIKKLNLILSGFGSLAVSLSVVWQFTGNTQVLMLYLLGVIGVIIGTIQKRFEIRTWGLMVVIFGICCAIVIPYDMYAGLIVSTKFGLEMLGIVALVISYFLYKEESLSDFEQGVHRGLQYIIAGLLWGFVSWDLMHYFSGYGQVNQRNLSLSLWWLILAVGLIAVSTIKTLKSLRKISLFLFGLVIIKVFLYDVQTLDTVYRIISFISLGVILLIVSFIYQHNKEKIKQLLE